MPPASRSSRRRRRIAATTIAAAVAAAMTAACGVGGATGAVADAGMPTVATAKASRADLVNTLTLTAEFEPFQEVEVMAKVAGYLHSINVDIGDRVRAGQLLATLELPEMADDLARAAAGTDEVTAESAGAQGDMTRAQSAHDAAHLSYARLLDVSKREKGLVPQQDLDEAHARDLVAEAQVAAAASKVAAGENHIRMAQAEESRFKTLEKYTRITAPFDGVVTKRFANVGSMIQAGTASQTQAMPIVRLSDNRMLRLTVPVPESSVGGIVVGQPVTVRVRSLNRTFDGRVARFTNRLQTSTRTMDTEIDVANPGLTLMPGMYAEADLVLQSASKALVVPLDAVEGLGTATARAYLIEADRIRIVPIKTGLETATQVEVLGGLHEGDAVIVGRRSGLTDGEQVRARPVTRDANQGKGD
jgi:RND family efflux transporter MFP subunit